MNAKRFLTIPALLASLAMVQAEKVLFENLPRPLQDAIRAHAGAEAVEDIDMEVRNGAAVYEVAFKRDGQNVEILFGPDGQLLAADGTPQLDSRKVPFPSLPPAVQQSVRTRAGNSFVEDVDRIVKDGKATYEIAFKQGGQQHEILVSDEGQILRDVAVGSAGEGTIDTGSGREGNLQPRRIEFAGGKKISLNEAPSAVQKTLLDRAEGAPIEDLEVGVWNSQPVYQAGFKAANEHIEIQVADDGRIIHDPRLSTGAGVPAASAIGRGSSRYSDVIQPVTVSAGRKIELREAPLRVQSTLRDQLGTAMVEDLELGSWKGRRVYEAGFKWNGQQVELQLDEDGRIIYDPRTTLDK